MLFPLFQGETLRLHGQCGDFIDPIHVSLTQSHCYENNKASLYNMYHNYSIPIEFTVALECTTLIIKQKVLD